MNDLSLATQKPTSVRHGVLGFACALSMITYLDRVCFGTVAPYVQSEFALSDSQLGWLFTSFALAYAAFEVPTGWLGDAFGARKTLIRIVIWWSIFTALTGAIYPSASAPLLSFGALLAVRFLFGIGEAGAYPNISCAFSNWFPFGERGRAQGAVWMAGRFGGGITPLLVMALVYHVTSYRDPAPADAVATVGVAASPQGAFSVAAGAAALSERVTHWRHIFWIFGALGVGWCLLFWWWFRDRPQDHSSVNAAELALINDVKPAAVALDLSARPGHGEPAADPRVVPGSAVEGIGRAPARAPVTSSPPAHGGHHSPRNVPWLALLSNLNLWTLCVMYFACAYGWYFNITWLPKYLRTGGGGHLSQAVTSETYGFWTFSLMAGMPLLFGSLACLVGGLLTDAFIRRTGNRRWGRRLFGMIGHSVCAVCYFLSLTAESPWLFVFFVAMAAFWNDITMGSAWASCIDVGGKYSGIVSGCMNTVGNLGGAIAGVSTGFVLDRFGPRDGWTINFVSFGMVYVIAVFLWMRFDATKQVPQSA